MRTRRTYFLFAVVILLSNYFLLNCSSAMKIQNPVVGIIRVVGNEPFTQLAVNLDGKTVYTLECTKEVKSELMKNQGKVYEIVYKEIKETNEGVTLVVEKIIKVNSK